MIQRQECIFHKKFACKCNQTFDTMQERKLLYQRAKTWLRDQGYNCKTNNWTTIVRAFVQGYTEAENRTVKT